MSEPEWQKFKIDPIFDNEGTQLKKLKGFMHAFIEWRQSQPEPSIVRLSESKGLTTNTRKVRKTRKKRAQ